MFWTIFLISAVLSVGFGDKQQNHNPNSNYDCTTKYCYDLDFNKHGRYHFGSKAPYPRYTDFNVNKEFNVPNCEPIKIWLTVRHAARLPTNSQVKDFKRLILLREQVLKNYQNVSHTNECRMCQADVDLLRNWKYQHKLKRMESNHLVPMGFDEMILIGKSFKKMFPTLFDGKYSNETYLFGFATEQRTRQSYYGFLHGVFGENSYMHVPMPHVNGNHDDPLFQPYIQCKESIQNADLHDTRNEQAGQFVDFDPFQQLIREVTNRLGLNDLIPEQWVTLIWDFCRYEQTWHPIEPSAWCAAFLPHHLPILEYYDDIKLYYKKSFGTPLTTKLACAAVNNMLYYLDSNDSYKVVAYFVHSTLIQLLYTALDLFKDSQHLRANNYDQMIDRKFKSSFMIPLSSNLAAVKYICPTERVKEKVIFFHNQQPIRLPWCHSNGMCDLNSVYETYEHFTRIDCNGSFCDIEFKGFIKNDETTFVGVYLTLVMLFMIVIGIWKMLQTHFKRNRLI